MSNEIGGGVGGVGTCTSRVSGGGAGADGVLRNKELKKEGQDNDGCNESGENDNDGSSKYP